MRTKCLFQGKDRGIVSQKSKPVKSIGQRRAVNPKRRNKMKFKQKMNLSTQTFIHAQSYIAWYIALNICLSETKMQNEKGFRT